MEKMRQQLMEWGKELETFRLPHWEELPDLELYMDQVRTLVDRYLSPVIQGEKHPLLTSSMVNNYVKLGLIPAPVKKRYNKEHVAFLLAITTLKQVLTIPEIKEAAVWMVSQLAQGKSHPQKFDQATPVEYIAVRAATLSFAMKLLAEKTIVLETEYLKEEKTNEK